MRENLTLLLATNNATEQPDQISGLILHSIRRIASEYHQDIPESHSADQPTTV